MWKVVNFISSREFCSLRINYCNKLMSVGQYSSLASKLVLMLKCLNSSIYHK